MFNTHLCFLPLMSSSSKHRPDVNPSAIHHHQCSINQAKVVGDWHELPPRLAKSEYGAFFSAREPQPQPQAWRQLDLPTSVQPRIGQHLALCNCYIDIMVERHKSMMTGPYRHIFVCYVSVSAHQLWQDCMLVKEQC
jgi:hypothetical protein